MFYRNVPNRVFSTKPNLKHIILTRNGHRDYCFGYNLTIREVILNEVLKNVSEMKNRIKLTLQSGSMLKGLHGTVFTVPRTFKNHSRGILKVWAHQCECVFAQRLRRGQQMFCHYTRLWEEHALKELMNRFRIQMTKCGKEFVFGAVGVASYNWDANRITNVEIDKYMNDIDYIRVLSDKTIACESCKSDHPEMFKRNLTICDCPNKDNDGRQYENWVTFIEQKDMVVWRRICKSGCYEYKVYGSFDNVTAEDFLNVQIDSDYRKKWDKTAVALEVVEKDPCPHSNSDIIYWEMEWPGLFVNRDYVFNRRFKIDVKNKKIVIASRGTSHPSCPVKPDKFRVDEYWSYMVVQPYEDLNRPGIEFGLTYYDNPGVNIPTKITSWVALRAMPEFLTNLREATVHYTAYCKEVDKQRAFDFTDQQQSDCTPDDEYEFIFDNTVFEPEHFMKSKRSHVKDDTNRKPETNDPETDLKSKNPVNIPSTISGTEVLLSPTSTIKAETNASHHSYWKYLHLNYYLS